MEVNAIFRRLARAGQGRSGTEDDGFVFLGSGFCSKGWDVLIVAIPFTIV